MAIHSSILAWEIPWTEDPGRLQSMRLQRVGEDLATKQQNQSLHVIMWLQWLQVSHPHPEITKGQQKISPFLMVLFKMRETFLKFPQTPPFMAP